MLNSLMKFQDHHFVWSLFLSVQTVNSFRTKEIPWKMQAHHTDNKNYTKKKKRWQAPSAYAKHATCVLLVLLFMEFKWLWHQRTNERIYHKRFVLNETLVPVFVSLKELRRFFSSFNTRRCTFLRYSILLLCYLNCLCVMRCELQKSVNWY